MVVDASVAVKWGVAEPGHDAAIMIVASGEELVSPTVLVAEAANVFRKKAKRGEMSRPQAFEALSGIRSAIGRFVDVTPWADITPPMTAAISSALESWACPSSRPTQFWRPKVRDAFGLAGRSFD